MIRSAVLIQYTRVTDRQTDGQTDGIGVAYTRYRYMLSHVKINRSPNFTWFLHEKITKIPNFT